VNIIAYRVTKIATNGERALNAGLASGVKHVAFRAKTIPVPVRWLFLLFIFTFPLDANLAGLGILSGGHSVPKVVGILLCAVYFFYYNPFFYKKILPYPSAALWWFVIYMVVYVLNGFWVAAELSLAEWTDDYYLGRLFTLVQTLLFFWIASNLLKDANFVKSVLIAYVIASAIVALGIVLQVPGFYEEMGERITTVGENPNAVALHMAIAVAIIISLYVNKSFRHFTSKVFFLILIPTILAVLVSTGSRAGMASALTACLIYLLPHWRSRRTMISITLGILAIVAVVYMVASNPASSERWKTSYYERDLAGREEIYPAAVEMILERPILGWAGHYTYELTLRLAGFSPHDRWTGTDPHNLYLHLLLEGGVVGTIPFVVGFCLCGWAAWTARRGNLGLLPLALFSVILIAGLSGNLVVWKSAWLVMALSVAWGSAAVAEQRVKQLLFRRTSAIG
jgi:O-antigen ligase